MGKRHIYYVFGITACGKTTVAPQLASLLGGEWLSNDLIYHTIQQEVTDKRYNALIDPAQLETYPRYIRGHFQYRQHQLYRQMLPNSNVVVIEGSCCTSDHDRLAIAACLGEDFEETFLLIDPEFQDWIKNVSNKFKMPIDELLENRDSWIERMKELKAKLIIPSGTYVFREAHEVLVPEPEIYQRMGLTDLKWNLLQMPDDFCGASVLDLGCNAGWIGEYCLRNQAGRVLGLDSNWRYLEQARARGLEVRRFDLNDIDFLIERFDYAICLSMMHYMDDQEAFIRRISCLANTLVLEVPIAQNGMDYEEKPGVFCGRCPSEILVQTWLNKYFKRVEPAGTSISPDSYTIRKIWKAYMDDRSHLDEKELWIHEWDDAALKDPNKAITGMTDPKAFRVTGIIDSARLLKILTNIFSGFTFTNRKILEHGCGSGRMSSILSPLFKHYECTDVSSVMLNLAREASPGVREFHLSKMDSIACRDDSFEIVFSFAVLMHARKINVFSLMKEFRRILSPGGHLIFQLPIYSNPCEASDYNQVSIWTLEEAMKLAEQSDLEIVKIVDCKREMGSKISEEHFEFHIFRRPL